MFNLEGTLFREIGIFCPTASSSTNEVAAFMPWDNNSDTGSSLYSKKYILGSLSF